MNTRTLWAIDAIHHTERGPFLTELWFLLSSFHTLCDMCQEAMGPKARYEGLVSFFL